MGCLGVALVNKGGTCNKPEDRKARKRSPDTKSQEFISPKYQPLYDHHLNKLCKAHIPNDTYQDPIVPETRILNIAWETIKSWDMDNRDFNWSTDLRGSRKFCQTLMT